MPPKQGRKVGPNTPDGPLGPSNQPTELPKNIISKDLLQRLNFMYQANAMLEGLSKDPLVHKSVRERFNKRRKVDTESGSKVEGRGQGLRSVVQTVGGPGYWNIARHSMLKLDPALKRSICKACNSISLPGLTATVRLKHSSTHFNTITTTCLNCTRSITIPAPPIKLPPAQPDAEASLTSLPAPPAPPLDGPRRAGRRRKAARHPPFWQREARPRTEAILEEQSLKHAETDAGRPDRKRSQKGGHSIWVEGDVLARWGVAVL